MVLSFIWALYAADPHRVVPGQMVAKAMMCFNNKIRSCRYIHDVMRAYRLTQSGNLNVPPEATDVFCNGPCLAETRLVLGCINGVISDFLFYNRATVRDITYALSAGCGSTGYRENNMLLFTVGDFNVARYIDDETSSASILPSLTGFYALALFMWWWILLL
ncbi:Glutamate synthase [Salix suchowensis]|nr:Glutamate synthase [Salix suchowensis]